MSKTVVDWIQDLASDDKQVWREASRALGYIGSEAIPSLLEALINEQAPLGRIGDVLGLIGIDALNALADLMMSKNNSAERIKAVRAIAHIKDVRLLPILIDGLRIKDDEVRAEVALSLHVFSDPRVVSPLLQTTQDTNPTVRAAATLALGSYYRDPRSKARLIALTKDDMSLVRRHAVRALASFNNDPEIPPLLDAMTNDPDEHVRQFAAASLQALKGDRMVFQRLDRNEGDITRIVDEAYEAMLSDGVLDEDDLNVMRHSNPMVRGRLLDAIGDKGRDTAIALILPALTDVNPAVRKTAIKALVRLGSLALEGMAKHLNDRSKYIRAGIVEAMGIIDDPACLDIIGHMVNDRAVEVRLQVVKTVSKFDDPRAIKILNSAKRDADKQVRDLAIEALNTLGVNENRISGFLRRWRKND